MSKGPWHCMSEGPWWKRLRIRYFGLTKSEITDNLTTASKIQMDIYRRIVAEEYEFNRQWNAKRAISPGSK